MIFSYPYIENVPSPSQTIPLSEGVKAARLLGGQFFDSLQNYTTVLDI